MKTSKIKVFLSKLFSGKTRSRYYEDENSDNYVIAHYSKRNEDLRFNSRHGSVEFLTTMRYIHRYTFEGAKILEIGAASGRYSHALALEGYEVDAIELVQKNIDIFNSKTQPGEKITVRQGNALDLSFIADESYDITLLLGPLYHLYTQEDKLKAMNEAIRVTKKGGVIFCAYCLCDVSILRYCFVKGHIHEVLENGLLKIGELNLGEYTYKVASRPEEIFEIVRKEDIDALVAQLEVERLNYVATDLYTNHIPETIDKLDDKTFEIYLNYHYFLCERPDMQGLSHHSVDILKRK